MTTLGWILTAVLVVLIAGMIATLAYICYRTEFHP